MAAKSRAHWHSSLSAIGRRLGGVLSVTVFFVFVVRFSVAIIPRIFALIFVIVIVIGRTQIDGIQEHAGNLSIHLHKDVAGAAQGLLGGLSGTDDQHDGVGAGRQHYGVGDR